MKLSTSFENRAPKRAIVDKITRVKSLSFIAPTLLEILFKAIVGGAGYVRLTRAGLTSVPFTQSCNRALSASIKGDVCTNFIASFHAALVDTSQGHL